ncbi:MAG: M56 family metallopeptidase, partial [Patescibacteria group bacterium]
LAVSGLLSFLLFRIYQVVYQYAGVLIHKIETACGCTQMNQLIAMHPFIFGSLIAASLIILSFLFFAIHKLLKLVFQTRKFTGYYLNNLRSGHSSKLRRAVLRLDLDKEVIVEAKDDAPAVFCFGFWQPKICVSHGLIKILHEDELKAVLLHEHYHLISREPMKLFVIRYFQSVFFFVPGIKTFIDKYFTFSELAADEKVMASAIDRSKLAGALLKMSESEEKQLLRHGLSLSFFSSVMAERVNKLSDSSYTPKFRLWKTSFLFGLCSVVLVVLTAFVFLSDSTKAFEMHSNGDCGLSNNGSNLFCDQHNNQKICARGDSSNPSVCNLQ